MKLLTYTSHKEHCDLYTEIHGLIAVNCCQIGLAQKDIIYCQVSLQYSIRLVHALVRKTIDLPNLASQQVLIQLMVLTQK